MDQLKYWKGKGFHIALNTISSGQWVLVVDCDPVNEWGRPGGRDFGLVHQITRFVSLPCDTPEDCIKAAMEVLQ